MKHKILNVFLTSYSKYVFSEPFSVLDLQMQKKSFYEHKYNKTKNYTSFYISDFSMIIKLSPVTKSSHVQNKTNKLIILTVTGYN